MALQIIHVISYQDVLGTCKVRAFKHKEVALKFSSKILQKGFTVWLSKLEYDDAVDLNICVDNTADFSPGPCGAGQDRGQKCDD